ncbi:MAG: Arc family DNA-binding protein, partial [Burkholderiales bacterium]
TMLRMREELRKRLEREAKKSGRSLNAEMVGRLEQSFTVDRNSSIIDAIIDMLVDDDNVSGAVLRQIALQMTKVPGAFHNEADIKNFLTGINFSAFGKNVINRELPEGDDR